MVSFSLLCILLFSSKMTVLAETVTPAPAKEPASTLNEEDAEKLLTTLKSMTCLSFVLKSANVSYDGHQVLEFPPTLPDTPGFKQAKELLGIPGLFEILSTPSKVYSFDVMICDEHAEIVKQLLYYYKFPFKIKIEDVGKLIKAEKETISDTMAPDANFSLDNYHSYETISKWLNQIPQDEEVKGYVTVEKFAKSSEKRDLHLVKISTNKKGFGKSPGILIVGGLHGHEWTTISTVLFLISKIIDIIKAKMDPKLTSSLDWYFIPIANPDGYTYTRTENRLWRKTRFQTAGQEDKCLGADPGRNFEFRFNETGKPGVPCSYIYEGDFAASEPEVAAIQSLLLRNKENIKLFISLHAYGEHIILPGLAGNIATAENKDLVAVAKIAKDSFNDGEKAAFDIIEPKDLFYVATGREIDYAKEIAKIKYSFQIDLGDDGESGYFLPASSTLETGVSVLKAIAQMMEEILAENAQGQGQGQTTTVVINEKKTVKKAGLLDEVLKLLEMLNTMMPMPNTMMNVKTMNMKTVNVKTGNGRTMGTNTMKPRTRKPRTRTPRTRRMRYHHGYSMSY